MSKRLTAAVAALGFLLVSVPASAQVITTVPAAAPVPAMPPWALLILGLGLMAVAFRALRGRGGRHATASLLALALAAALLSYGPAVWAAIASTFTNPAGETLAIPVTQIPSGPDLAGWELADFTNSSGAALKVDAIALPAYADCLPERAERRAAAGRRAAALAAPDVRRGPDPERRRHVPRGRGHDVPGAGDASSRRAHLHRGVIRHGVGRCGRHADRHEPDGDDGRDARRRGGHERQRRELHLRDRRDPGPCGRGRRRGHQHAAGKRDADQRLHLPHHGRGTALGWRGHRGARRRPEQPHCRHGRQQYRASSGVESARRRGGAEQYGRCRQHHGDRRRPRRERRHSVWRTALLRLRGGLAGQYALSGRQRLLQRLVPALEGSADLLFGNRSGHRRLHRRASTGAPPSFRTIPRSTPSADNFNSGCAGRPTTRASAASSAASARSRPDG